MNDQSTAEQLVDPLLMREYLLQNPNFFERYPELLEHLKLTDPARGTVSLVERQQQQLRQRVSQLEEEITALLANAARNEDVHNFYSQLLFDLLAIDDIDSMAAELKAQLIDKFRFTSVNLFRREDSGDFNQPEIATILSQRLDHRGYYLGRLPAQQASILVGIETGSVALIGLGDNKRWHGVLAVASHDPSHFSPSMGTMLLDNLQRLLSHRLVHG